METPGYGEIISVFYITFYTIGSAMSFVVGVDKLPWSFYQGNEIESGYVLYQLIKESDAR